jgi:hypothetical protein
MKLYADYLKEREGKDCLFNDHSFIIYKIYEEEISVIDMYTSPEKRGSFSLKSLIIEFYKIAKENEIKKLYGFTDPSTRGWEKSEKMMLKYGFKKIKTEDSGYNHYLLTIEEN